MIQCCNFWPAAGAELVARTETDGWQTPWPISTPPPSRPRTAFVTWSWLLWGSGARWQTAPLCSRIRATWSKRWSTTCSSVMYSCTGRLPFRRKQACRAGMAAVKTPDAPLEPAADRPTPRPAGLRRRLGEALAKRSSGACSTPTSSRTTTCWCACARLWKTADGRRGVPRLRERYRVVLVDEFQDTDLLQWDDRPPCLWRWRYQARPDRRPQTGRLLVPRC